MEIIFTHAPESHGCKPVDEWLSVRGYALRNPVEKEATAVKPWSFTIVGTIITIVSFGYAIYANRKHSKLVNYNREQAWEIYRQASTVLAAYQRLEKMNINDKEASMTIAKAEAHARELALNSIKMIKRFEKKFTKETIGEWAKEGKLDPHESRIEAFQKLVETE